MKTKSDKASVDGRYSVYGTVRNQLQQPVAGAIVSAFDKDIRSEQSLGKVQTNAQGYYMITYTQQQFADTDKNAADVFLRVYDATGKLLKQSDVYYNASALLNIDITLGDQPYKGASEFENMLAGVTPFTGKLTLDTLTENVQTQDITFLTNKTNLQQDRIEALAMAYRFQTLTKIYAAVYYGLLREGVPGNTTQRLLQNVSAPTFEQQLQQKLDGIMHENINVLMQSLQQAIDDNIIPFALSAEFEKIKEQLIRIMAIYAKEHPQTGVTSILFQKIQSSGFYDEDSKKVMEELSKHQGDFDSFFSALTENVTLSKNTNQLQTVFALSNLTNDHLPLVEHLVNTQKLKKPDDIKETCS